MQQEDSNPPTPPNNTAEIVSHRLRALCTLVKQRADVKTCGLHRTGIGAELAKISQAERNMMMDFADKAAGAAENMRDAHSEIERTELRVCMLLAQAEISESDFNRLGTIESVEVEIECRSQILSLTPETHAGRSYHLGKLGISLTKRFECLDEPTDLNKAIEYLIEAVQLTSDGGPDGGLYAVPLRSYLGTAYQCRFRRLGDLSDLEQAISQKTQAVLLTPDGHGTMPSRLENLGNSYRLRFERLGVVADIDKSIENLHQALMVMKANSIFSRISESLVNVDLNTLASLEMWMRQLNIRRSRCYLLRMIIQPGGIG